MRRVELIMLVGERAHFVPSSVDRTASRFYPMFQVMDCAINRACDSGAVKFNLGGLPSTDAVGLVQFKESWGARPLQIVQLRYVAPLTRLYAYTRAFLRFAPSPAPKVAS